MGKANNMNFILKKPGTSVGKVLQTKLKENTANDILRQKNITNGLIGPAGPPGG